MTLEYADSHGHLTMVFEGGEMKGAPRDATAEEVKDLVDRARDAGVTRILVPGTHRADLRLAVDIAERYDGVYAAVGIHPHEAKEFDEDEDLIQQCIEVIRSEQKASVSLLQRRLRLGYTRAARIMDELENRGIVGPSKGAEPRDILIDLDGTGADGSGIEPSH